MSTSLYFTSNLTFVKIHAQFVYSRTHPRKEKQRKRFNFFQMMGIMEKYVLLHTFVSVWRRIKCLKILNRQDRNNRSIVFIRTKTVLDNRQEPASLDILMNMDIKANQQLKIWHIRWRHFPIFNVPYLCTNHWIYSCMLCERNVYR